MPKKSRFGAVAWYTAAEVKKIVKAAVAENTDRLLKEEITRLDTALLDEQIKQARINGRI